MIEPLAMYMAKLYQPMAKNDRLLQHLAVGMLESGEFLKEMGIVDPEAHKWLAVYARNLERICGMRRIAFGQVPIMVSRWMDDEERTEAPKTDLKKWFGHMLTDFTQPATRAFALRARAELGQLHKGALTLPSKAKSYNAARWFWHQLHPRVQDASGKDFPAPCSKEHCPMIWRENDKTSFPVAALFDMQISAKKSQYEKTMCAALARNVVLAKEGKPLEAMPRSSEGGDELLPEDVVKDMQAKGAKK